MPVAEFGQLAEVPEPSRSRTYGVSGTEKTIQVSAPVSDAVRTRTSRRASARPSSPSQPLGFSVRRATPTPPARRRDAAPTSHLPLGYCVTYQMHCTTDYLARSTEYQSFSSPNRTSRRTVPLSTPASVWKGSDEELVARGTERETGQRATFIIQRGGRDHRRTCRYRAAGASTSKQRAPPSQFR